LETAQHRFTETQQLLVSQCGPAGQAPDSAGLSIAGGNEEWGSNRGSPQASALSFSRIQNHIPKRCIWDAPEEPRISQLKQAVSFKMDNWRKKETTSGTTYHAAPALILRYEKNLVQNFATEELPCASGHMYSD